MNSREEDWVRRFIEEHHLTNRVSVSTAANAIVEDLADRYDGTVREVSSGEEVLTWIIPRQWEVNEAWIATVDGEKILDFRDHPLHLKSYSDSFQGVVSRGELKEKITTDPEEPDQVPYHYAWQFAHDPEPDWGFCASHKFLEKLDDPEYRVKVDTEFSDGKMKMFDWELPGESDKTIYFAAHTCHPGQVNDGLSCIALLAVLFNRLSKKDHRKNTYRLFVGPEYFTAAALMDQLDLENHLAGGIFLDRPGFEEPLGFSQSFEGNRYIDRVVETVFREELDDFVKLDYRKIAGNDEMIYDGPDFEIPTVPIGRLNSPYMHSQKDNLSNTSFGSLEECLDVLTRVTEVLEADFVPVREYTGNLYFSRYGLAEAVGTFNGNEENPQTFHYLQRFLDGERSCVDLADELDMGFARVFDLLKSMSDRGLVGARSVRPIERDAQARNP